MNSLETKFWILDTAKSIWNKAQTMACIGDIPPIEFSTKKSSVAGFAYYSGKVEFNLAYFCTHDNLKDLEDTIAHELVHIICYRIYPNRKQEHGPEFRHFMQILGYSGNTYHQFSVSKAKSKVKTIRDEIILLDL
jgi:predicted SprT family Zn-dependent metalloprotease